MVVRDMETRGEELRRKRVVLTDFTICLEFPSPEEAEHAALVLRAYAIHKKYRERDKVYHTKGSNRVCITYSPGAHMNDYPRAFIHDVIERIYNALRIMYERWDRV